MLAWMATLGCGFGDLQLRSESRADQVGARIAYDGTLTFERSFWSAATPGRTAVDVAMVALSGSLVRLPFVLLYFDARSRRDDYIARRDFMSSTFAWRARLSARAREEDLRRALAELPRRLAAIWSNVRVPVVERRRLLHEEWADTNDEASGATARRIIERFMEVSHGRGYVRHLFDGDATWTSANGWRNPSRSIGRTSGASPIACSAR